MNDINAPAQPSESSTKPYLLRAIYQWAVDHALTPQVLVDSGVDGVAVPENCVQDGRIVLTIHPQSVRDLHLGNEHICFSARFAGKPFAVDIPVAAVMAIYCRENGRGIYFHAIADAATETHDEIHDETHAKTDGKTDNTTNDEIGNDKTGGKVDGKTAAHAPDKHGKHGKHDKSRQRTAPPKLRLVK